MRKVRAALRVRGRVQGVNFRYFTASAARQHDVHGWVRNLDDGDVEAVLEGRENDVRQVIDHCRQGPSQARVDELSIDLEEYRGEFVDFEVRYD
jgi:acylphosphatase